MKVDDHSFYGVIKNSPLFLLYDGFLAVFLFFCMSGFVLTRAYEKSLAGWVDQIQSRIARLWVPTIAFGIFSLCLIALFRHRHDDLANVINSNTLSCCWRVDKSWLAILQEIFVNPLFLGYSDNYPMWSMIPLPSSAHFLIKSGNALNSPVWTMNVELQGSLLILLCVRLKERASVFWAAFVACAFCLLPAAFGAFLVGHMAAVFRFDEKKFRLPFWMNEAIAFCIMVWGIMRVAEAETDVAATFKISVLIFLGVIRSGVAKAMFTSRRLVRLGELSVTIYLVHWAIVFGPGSEAILMCIPVFGVEASRLIGVVAVVLFIVMISNPLSVVDRLAVDISHAVKRRERLDWRKLLPPAIWERAARQSLDNA